MQRQTIDGLEYCLTQEFSSQTVYSPCPPPNAAAVLGLSTIAAVAVLSVTWVIPEITRRKSQYQTVILNAKRSL